jgi:hypothetical protein
MLIRRSTLTVALIACCSTANAQGVTPFCDMLYWHASEEASGVWSNVLSSSSSGSSFSAETMQFNWSPGFRVGLGHESDEGSWDVKLYWTCFRTSQEAAVSGDIVVPEFFSGAISGDGRTFNAGSIDWNLTYNTIDLEAGRKVPVGESAWIRPSMGIQAAIIQQRIQLGLANPGLSISAEEDVTHNFWGIGPSFSISGAWNLPKCSNLSLIGSFSADLLFGQWNVNDAYARTDNQLPLGVYRAVVTSMKDSSLGVPVLKYFLGIQWVREGSVTSTVRAGYELQWWANQQRLPAFQQLPMHGDLTLTGLTCGVSVGF